jgi:YhcH/YjgK/YiaL family protein
MICAKLDTPSTYTPLTGHALWGEVLAALRTLDEHSPLGIIELRGKDMFINVHTYETLPKDECRFEGHRDMIDVQYIIEGGELVDWILKEELEEDGPYLAEKDFQYYAAPRAQRMADSDGGLPEMAKQWVMTDDDGLRIADGGMPLTRLHLKAGYFGVFFPEDGHRPKLNDGIHKGVYKAVVKIHRKLLEVR